MFLKLDYGNKIFLHEIIFEPLSGCRRYIANIGYLIWENRKN